MKPIKFEGSNTTFAKDQPEYLQLPAYRDEDGTVITEWELSDEERARIAKGENLRISTLTFNNPLQPFRPYLPSMTDIYEAEDNGKKQSYASDRVCGSAPLQGGETHDQALQE
jgi:hypothetical protein